MKQQLVTYRSDHKLEILDQFERSFNIVEITEIWVVRSIPPEEAWAAVAAKSFTGTWITIWTDRLTILDCYKRRCYRIERVVGEKDQYIAYVAYPLDLFEEGSVTNMFTPL
ncbi:hypothetical protein RND71_031923 [Anisodus tanguticus]|uniref:Ribulose bisphosphate carboxylase large chain n=1 Tax=Anisodus tanguticus TaxID=243964 RepID=A0AAE1RCQ7_9SOLA|nr:hypothetical protein RND71_031923 [Anisodus tanguticus]